MIMQMGVRISASVYLEEEAKAEGPLAGVGKYSMRLDPQKTSPNKMVQTLTSHMSMSDLGYSDCLVLIT